MSYYALHLLISRFIQQIEHAEEWRNGGIYAGGRQKETSVAADIGRGGVSRGTAEQRGGGASGEVREGI
jgi:hypothetical protein